MDQYPTPLWEAPKLLGGIDRPRSSFLLLPGIPEQRDGRHQMQGILATEGDFYKKRHHDAVLSAIIAKYGYLNEDLKAQISGLMKWWFTASSTLPAWVTILPQRVMRESRHDRGFSPIHTPTTFVPVVKGHKIQGSRISVNGVGDLPSEWLVMAPKQGELIENTHLVNQVVRRTLVEREPVLGRTPRCFSIMERWWYLATLGCQDDLADARAALIPAMHHLLKDGIQWAFLISLCRLSTCHKKVILFCCNLDPFDNRLLDFREMTYSAAFYFLWNPSNHGLLRQTITPGQWDEL